MMVLSKIVLLIIVTTFSFCECDPAVDTHNIVQCTNVEKPKLLLEAIKVSVPGSFLRVKTHTIVYPTHGVNNKKITCLKVLDRDQDGKGAYPKILNGGLQSYDVTVQFVSQLSKGINFLVEIYADKTTNSHTKENKN